MAFATQLDIKRIQTLTDSIFAVAMTILILEIRIPFKLNSEHLVKYFLHNTLSELFFYFLSFVILGIFWIGSHFHHHLIVETDRVSSWFNIFFLMMICVIPFSAAFINHYRHEKLSIIFYSVNLILASFCHFLMLVYSWKKKYTKPQLTYADYKNARRRIMIPIYFYMAIIGTSFFSTNVAICLFLVPVILHVIPESGNEKVNKKINGSA